MRTPSSPSLVYHLSASLALSSSSLLAGAEYRHFCSSSWAEEFVLRCRSPRYFLWSPLQMNWKCSFFFFLAILHSFRFCAVRMSALQGLSTHFFSAFLLSAVLYHALFYIHSLALVPDVVSGFRKKSRAVAVVVKDA